MSAGCANLTDSSATTAASRTWTLYKSLPGLLECVLRPGDGEHVAREQLLVTRRQNHIGLASVNGNYGGAGLAP